MNKQTTIEAATGHHVYAAIAAVQGELATIGIAKTRRNSQGSGYNFRGIDDVYGALSPLLAKHNLVVIPRITTRELVERQSKNGGALFYVTVHAEFDFVSAIDGSIHVAATFGEAMDSGDKATNKAMSAAYKYAAFMTFAIPTEGDNDADSATHEVAAAPARITADEPPVRPAEKLDGPYSSASKLKAAIKAFAESLRIYTDDLAGFNAWMATDEVILLERQALRYLPGWWETGDDMPPEFEPIASRIQRKAKELEELDSIANSPAAKMVRAG